MNWLIIVGFLIVVGILYTVHQPTDETKEGFMNTSDTVFLIFSIVPSVVAVSVLVWIFISNKMWK
jgi:hypothetical protein